uniref:Uncharacterized protein n=1 Tax=Anopheles atroparvus TaxID=41427 RepID=A0AAG5D6A1_ANOAO
MENMKNDLMSKAQSVGDDTDRLADDLMKETEDLMRDAETGIAHHEMTTRITSAEDEPEIERILADGADTPDSPKATLHSLAVPASEAARAGKDEGMPLGAPGHPGEDKPDV